MTNDKKLVFVSGVFDTFHIGHSHILREAAKLGRVIVGINSDDYAARTKGPNRPIDTWELRCRNVLDTGLVEDVYWFDEDTPLSIIQTLGPDILVVGDDYCLNEIAGAGEVKSYGGEIVIIPRLPGISTTEIIASKNGS